MPRQNRSMNSLLGGACKVRKRGCSSTSSSSSALHNYKFKRAIFVGRKGGSSTPAPSWKAIARSPSSTLGAEPKLESSQNKPPLKQPVKAKHAPVVSARKLGATLWEMNETVSHSGRYANSLPRHLSDPSHSSVSDDQSGSGGIWRRMQVVSERVRSKNRSSRGLDSLSNGSFMEIESRSRGLTPTGSLLAMKCRSHMKDFNNDLMTSKELLKTLNRIRGLEEQHSSSMSLVSSLLTELEHTRLQINQLIEEQKSYRNEINYLMRRFTEEKVAWRDEEQSKIRMAVQSVVEELEVEKKLRRKTERLNQKLGLELSELKASLLKANEELEDERRSRELVEQVCDDLVRGMGEDKAEVDKLKRESAKAKEELEKEREMLQLADVWREERVQMKLSEAKFQLEEKNAAVDRLRDELEVFLQTKSGEIDERWQPTDIGSKIDGEVEADDDDYDDDDLDESDLHSIELNVDNNSKSYSWSYATKASSEEEKKDGSSLDIGIECESIQKSLLKEDKKLYEKLDQDVERYKSVKGLRDHVMFGLKIGSTNDQIGEASKISDMVRATRENSLKLRLVGVKTMVTPSVSR
ncbi:hypothetical protein QJS04_geneDACA021517 [Acorus gramineus]|uniref:Uncharacterized protein n=1 Tax=Acorus gramineus TaxID=55184 RepID=A0AAV9A746_ACOGR|nr:hypothetical protein QJS04_geneDACA021517 [Acorus gramineus]